MSGDPYVYPGTYVLINKIGIRDEARLELLERRVAAQRARQGVPPGNFDLAHLCAIHRHLFEDIYDWAGTPRTINIAKGGSMFQPVRFIAPGMADIHRRLRETRFLAGLSPVDFAREAGAIIGDVNYVHPFREGNGRTQLQYLKQLADRAGHPIDLNKLDPARCTRPRFPLTTPTTSRWACASPRCSTENKFRHPLDTPGCRHHLRPGDVEDRAMRAIGGR